MMEFIGHAGQGFATALSPQTLLFCFLGVTAGTFIGVLPGIGPLATIAMLLPLTFYLDPTTALVFLSGIYYGAEYGGSTASIMLNLPGTSSNAITCLDGYPMAQNGKAGIALTVTTYVSFFGGCIGILLLTNIGWFLLFGAESDSIERRRGSPSCQRDAGAL